MDTKFNFNSQVCTSRTQSERLLELGLKKETADMRHEVYISAVPDGIRKPKWRVSVGFYVGNGYIPAWSIHRLMEMVDPWEYKNWIGEDIEQDYDNMIQCISFLIDDRRFNKEYLVDQEAIEEHCKGVLEYLDYIREED